MKEKKVYSEPTVEVQKVEYEDVIRTSGEDPLSMYALSDDGEDIK